MSNNTKAAEKRSARRHPVKVKVDYQYEGHFLFEYATDISQHGIFLESDTPLPPGSKVQLQFAVPETKKTLVVVGEVTWINGKHEGSRNPGMGIKFDRLTELDREVLTSLIRRLAIL